VKKKIAAFLIAIMALTVAAAVVPVAAQPYSVNRGKSTGAVPVYLWVAGTRTRQPVAWAQVAPTRGGNFVVTKVIPVDGAKALRNGQQLNLWLQVGRSVRSPGLFLARLVKVDGRILLVFPKVLPVQGTVALQVLTRQATLVVTLA